MVANLSLCCFAVMGAPEGGEIVDVVVLLKLLLLFDNKWLYFFIPNVVVDVEVPSDDDIMGGIIACGVDGIEVLRCSALKLSGFPRHTRRGEEVER